ncbi:hypothetical protein [Nocardia inohanensis]|uniref:hypothetical protein n=1 Tax=Nocardia inohanensis TaxID=209246 RepID=UPI00082E4D77|nr:hypothetical protein [Nocardia inohanensis]
MTGSNVLARYADKAKGQVGGLVAKVAGSGSGAAAARTLTIGAPRAEVERFWRDPERLSAVLDGLGVVRMSAPGRYEWTVRPAESEPVTWQTTLTETEDGLRYAGDSDAPRIELVFRDAPADLGTEVTLRASTALPEFLTGAAAYAALYRARALLQTGELPTLEPLASARTGAHGKGE